LFTELILENGITDKKRRGKGRLDKMEERDYIGKIWDNGSKAEAGNGKEGEYGHYNTA